MITKHLSIFGLSACVALAACTPKAPEPALEAEKFGPATPLPQTSTLALDPDEVAAGRAIAVAACGDCHGLDADHPSPREDAPQMSAMLARYNADALAEDLIDGIKLGHEDMPLFDFDIPSTDSLIAYLRSVRKD